MASNKAKVREEIEKVARVTRTWIEHVSDGDAWRYVVVVEVDFDTDPNSTSFDKRAIQDIDQAAAHAAANTTMHIGGVRIVPKH